MSYSNIVLVHGFNVKDRGKTTTDRLIPYISNKYEVLQADYGWLGLFGVRVFNANIASLIAGMTPKKSIGIGHSNGCAILTEAVELGAKIDKLILINPALDYDFEFPPTIKRVDVFYNPTDITVISAKFFPFHRWGDMGRRGWVQDKRITRLPTVYNHNTESLFGAKGHSGVFDYSEELITYMTERGIL